MVPIRTCVGCFQKFPQKELLAITRLKNGDIVVDKEQKSAGRSVYLCYKMSCMEKARKRKGKNGLQYGLKVPIAQEIWETIQTIFNDQSPLSPLSPLS